VDRINRLVFWVGGVVLPAISQVCLEVLAPDREQVGLRLELLDLEKALWTGAISTEDFCLGAIGLTGATLVVDDLLAEIPKRADPLPGMPGVIGDLAADYELALVSDYPRRWLLPAMQRGGLSRWFADETVFCVSEHAVSGEYPELFETLVTSKVIIPGSSLWVDHNPSRTSVAIRQGIDASVFVDADRLYRDLGLWGLVPLEQRRGPVGQG
jgi:hypothetical protein